MPLVAVIPVKSFALGKRRLAGSIDPDVRTRLARGLAEHVASTVDATGMMPLIVTADAHVAEWATRSGFPSVVDPGRGLNAAADTGVAWAATSGSSWIVLHADLPLIEATDVVTLSGLLEEGPVIAPSSDGGTSAIGAGRPIGFSFGEASFHRHLAAVPDARIVVRSGLLLDVDSPIDLQAAVSDPRGAWIRELVPGTRTASPGRILY